MFGRLAKNPIIFRTSAIIESSASRDGFLAEGSWELTNDQPLLVNSQSRGPYEVSMAIWKLGNPEKNEQRVFSTLKSIGHINGILCFFFQCIYLHKEISTAMTKTDLISPVRAREPYISS